MTSERPKEIPMQTYIGTKIVRAKPMTRRAYNHRHGWTLPSDENGDDEGYLVEYTAGGNPNHPDFPAHISWSPKDVFERAYDGKFMSFGHALELLKDGRQVYRKGWNGKGIWLILVRPEDDDTPHDGPGYSLWRMQSIVGEALPWIGMRTADDKFVPWLASQTDMLADDWMVAE